MNLTELQNEVSDWSGKNFGSHKDVGHQEAKIDAVGNIVIFLANYCTSQGIAFGGAVAHTWEKVKKRNWKENAEDGTEKKPDDKSKYMRFQLQNRYQDSGWENLTNGRFESLPTATWKARELSADPITYGMVRVVDLYDNSTVATFTAGHEAQKGCGDEESDVCQTCGGKGWIKGKTYLDDLPCANCYKNSIKKKEWRYQLQSRLQDSGWENRPNKKFESHWEAFTAARKLSKNVFNGMIRVVDLSDNSVMDTFSAGG